METHRSLDERNQTQGTVESRLANRGAIKKDARRFVIEPVRGADIDSTLFIAMATAERTQKSQSFGTLTD